MNYKLSKIAALLMSVSVSGAIIANENSFSVIEGIASGDRSFATQSGEASGDNSFAVQNGVASGADSFAVQNGVASGGQSFAAIGGIASGGSSVAMQGGEASGDRSFATQGGEASGNQSFATQSGQALGDGSAAMNFGIAKGSSSLAIGMAPWTYDFYRDVSSKEESVAAGDYSTAIRGRAYGNGSLAINGGVALNHFNIAIGRLTVADSDGDIYNSSVAIGNQATAQYGSVSIGNFANYGAYTKAQTLAYTPAEHSVSIGTYAHVLNNDGVAIGSYSLSNTAAGQTGYLANEKEDATWKSTAAAFSIGNNGVDALFSERGFVSRQLTGLAAGTADTDAVNVAQLKVVKSIADAALAAATNNIVDTNTQSVTKAGNGISVTSSDNAQGTKDYTVSIKTGRGLKVDENGAITTTAVGAVKGDDKNILATTDSNGDVSIKLNDDIELNSVKVKQAGKVSADSTDVVIGSQLFEVKDNTEKLETKTAQAQSTANQAKAQADNAMTKVKALDEVVVKYDKNTKDKVTLAGAGGTTITNVKDGAVNATSRDVVNGSQLHSTNVRVTENTKAINRLANKTNQLDNRVAKLDKKMRGFASNSIAIASLPQVYGNGKSMLAVGTGSQGGSSSLAVGYSRASDSGHAVFKVNAAASHRGEVGVGAGIGFQW